MRSYQPYLSMILSLDMANIATQQSTNTSQLIKNMELQATVLEQVGAGKFTNVD